MVGAPPQLGPLVNDQKKKKNHQSLSPEIDYTLASPDLVKPK